MKKFLIFTISFIFVIALTFSLSVTAFAEESKTSESFNEEAVTEQESRSLFSEIYTLAVKNSDKLFSALAFLSSLLIVFAYKRGLIPIINTGLSAIKKSTDDFEEKASESILKTEESLKFLTDKFASCVNAIEITLKYIDGLSEKLEYLESEKNAAQTLKNVMLSQIDMLQEIFMNSALPQYSKDAIGEKVAQMKKNITLGEENV